jgi:cell division septum initiation protein DivIVA
MADLESRVTDTHDSEERITRTLVLAQKTADEVVREARFEAQQILSQARLDASEIESEHAGKKERLGSEVQTLQSAVAELRAHVKGLTDRLLAQVDEAESAMDGIVPAEMEPAEMEAAEMEPAETIVESGFTEEVAYVEDTMDEGFPVDVEDIDDEVDDDEAQAGEVYLGSDRRPWERYGD